MEQDRKVKIISLVAVIVAIIGLTLAFAAMSRTLKINGSANTDPVNWEIYFDNLSSPSTVGEGVATNTPTLATKGASITNMNVTLKKPGDSVTYTVDIVNNGDVDAEINDIDVTDFTSRQLELLDFKVVYTGTNNAPAEHDMLASKETKNITITFTYKDITDESKLPKSPEAISVDYSIEYVQSNTKVTTTTQAGSNYGEEIASGSLGNGITATYYGGTPIAKADSGVMAMSNNKLADDVRYEGGTLVISGSGALPDCETPFNMDLIMFLTDTNTVEELISLYDGDMFTLKYNPTSAIVEDGITSIGSDTFSKTSISNITISSSVLSIESSDIFLVNITLNEGLESIGIDAFAFFAGTSIRIPSTVTSIGSYFLERSETIEEVYIAGENIEIDSNAFKNIDNNFIVYCKNQSVANQISGNNITVIVDASQFN